ncbi:MAG TPA: polysaccharide deacetylase family protein [Caulobacteraceae bacterium]|jgi:peptidoglycan/xylan/chitin deacetylase (PgdA/CDA1 family)/spore germination protein YaaH/GT2 family glycosyltransferase|nr:polysaccharide deacetylase family protein [Caulobacteraceae bacterium]
MGETPPAVDPAAETPPAVGHGSVFLDPTGRRAHGVRVAAAVVVAGAILLLAGFLASLVAPPLLQSGLSTAPRAGSHVVGRKFAKARKDLFVRIADDERAVSRAPPSRAPNIAGAYFAPWVKGGLDAFQAHAADLTHVYPVWLQLSADGRSINTDAWTAKNGGTQDLVRIAAAKSVRVIPVLGDSAGGAFQGGRVDAMLKDPAAAQAVADAAVNFVVANGYGGLQIDFELLSPGAAQKLAPWLASLAQRLHATGRELSVALEGDLDAASIRRLAAPVDYAVAMAYDEHEISDKAGPVASAAFVNDSLKRFAGLIGRDKLLLGVGAYGYDWTTDSTDVTPVTNQAAVALAAGYRDGEKPSDVIDFDPNALEPTFQYNDEKGEPHEVWFLDAATVANAMTLARSYQVHGAALWALGMEDSSTWQAFGRNAKPNPDIQRVTSPQGVQFVGDGELLRIARTPEPGARVYERDGATGLITDETYTAYPAGWVVQRSGAPPKTVALTFDDGPDPTWTAKILDVLKRRGVPATFFMIGQNAADHANLVRRIYAEGHEIGNHSFTHPNMAHVGPERVRLELTATQRAIEAILKRSVALFRPPYNADSEPNSYGELMPVAVAYQAGYVTAGETIDPHDWDTTHRPDGKPGRLTGPDIVASVLAQVDHGQAVLLHDSGGDRSATLAALDPLITALQQRGYRFSTIGELEGRSRDQTMPQLSPADLRLARIDSVAFGMNHAFQVFLFWGFSAAIVLGLARIALMIGLAAGRRPHAPEAPADSLPAIDVLVAAYNEAPVIAGTIRSLLGSRDVAVRVIVVDDGSQDGTGDVVEAEFAGDPRVLLLRKSNGGKASALNVALAAATAPVVVGVDADTQLAPDALARLDQWFVDPTVGAVAGNVKVGNQHNLVTRWQSLEYITSQNIDRRAMARLNAVTVVPGAIGAWRTAALRAVGGYRSDTLAEDMDLTWRIHRDGWSIANEPRAHAYTEAPDTLSGLLKQRFRWTFGTLQCLWKHRSAVFHNGWFGWLALPSLWLFQIAAQILAPLVDLQLLFAAISGLNKWIDSLIHTDVDAAADPMLWVVVGIYVAFLALELAAGWVAYGLDRSNRKEIWLLPTQRFVYRQIMYVVVWRSLLRAAGGVGHAWGKLRRTGDVRLGNVAEP